MRDPCTTFTSAALEGEASSVNALHHPYSTVEIHVHAHTSKAHPHCYMLHAAAGTATARVQGRAWAQGAAASVTALVAAAVKRAMMVMMHLTHCMMSTLQQARQQAAVTCWGGMLNRRRTGSCRAHSHSRQVGCCAVVMS